MLEKVIALWSGLSARDRRMLTILLVFTALVLTWMVCLEPALNGSARLSRDLPKLRADLAQVDQYAREAQQTAVAAQASTESPLELKARLQRSLDETGLASSVAQLDLNGRNIEARFNTVEFERWLYWLDAAVRDTRLRLVDMAITRESSGSISGRVAFEVPGGAS